MKMSNKEKDYMAVIVAAILIGAFIWLITGAIFYVCKVFGEELTKQDQINRWYAEEQIKTEMRYLALKDYVDNMSEEEYIQTFFAEEK